MEFMSSFREDSVERNMRLYSEGSAWTSEKPGEDGEGKGGALPSEQPASSTLSLRKTLSFQPDELMGFFDLPGEHRDFHGPLGNMYPTDFISRPQRHCPTTWEATMSVSESWPTQRAEETGGFRERRFFGFSCLRDSVVWE